MYALRELAKQVQPEIIIHLTARAGFRPLIEQLLCTNVNVAGTVTILEIARAFKVQRMILWLVECSVRHYQQHSFFAKIIFRCRTEPVFLTEMGNGAGYLC